MNLKMFDIIRYLLKWKYRIIAAVVLAFFAARFYVGTIQTSVGKVVIKYNDAQIAEGKFPDGKDFDRYQIVSPEVLQNVINTLGLADNVEALRRRIDVTPVVPTAVEEVKSAKAKDGEEYTYNADTFVVSYWGKPDQMAYQVRTLLETLTFKYIDYYSEAYNDFATINNSLADENIEKYDYIEITEIIENNIEEILTKLKSYKSSDKDFRSNSTGYSFQDLIYEYEHLQTIDIPAIYANIYKGKISKNTDRLIELYRQREDEALLKQKNFNETAQMTKTKMESFSKANKELPNAYNYKRNGQNDDGLRILDGVYDETAQRSASKTTYDTLIEDYTNQLISANDAYLEAMHCKKIADTFEEKASGDVGSEEIANRVKSSVEELKNNVEALYASVSDTIDDYNDFSAQKHISLLTGVNSYDSVSARLYELLAVMLAGALSIILALTVEIIKAYKAEENKTLSEAEGARGITKCSEKKG